MGKNYHPIMKTRGAVGKRVVFKQYKNGEVITKFPDMSRIVASSEQRTWGIFLTICKSDQ